MDARPKAAAVSFDDASSGNILPDFATRIQYHITDQARRLAGFGPDWFKNDPDRASTRRSCTTRSSATT